MSEDLESAPTMAEGPTPAGAAVGGQESRHVPGGGIDVWGNPDASASPLARLEGGDVVQVIGRRGRWVHVSTTDGLDGWVDGPQLAGVEIGAGTPIADRSPTDSHGSVQIGREAVVEKAKSPLLISTGPVLGFLAALVVIVGTYLPWLQGQILRGEDLNAFDISWKVLGDWRDVVKPGFDLGTLLVVLAIVGGVVSLVAGGGVIRRILGLVIMIVCAVYVLQWQDQLTGQGAGLGSGANVWDIVDIGVLVSFGGGLGMLAARSR